MITRLVSNSKVYNLVSGAVSEQINTAGYKSAKVVVKSTSLQSGAQTIQFTDDKGNPITLYGKNYKTPKIVLTQYFTTDVNSGEWVMDLSQTDELNISVDRNGFSQGNMYIYFSYDQIEVNNDYPDGHFITYGADDFRSFEFDVKDNYALVSLKFTATSQNDVTFRFYAMAEDSDEYVVIGPYDYNTGDRYRTTYNITKNDFDFWVYTSGYKKFKVSVNTEYRNTAPITISVKQTHTLKRTIRVYDKSVLLPSYTKGKARYIALDFRSTTVTNQNGWATIFTKDIPTFYSRTGRELMLNETTEIRLNSTRTLENGVEYQTLFQFAAETVNGGIVYQFSNITDVLNVVLTTNPNKLKPNGSLTYNGNLYVTISDEDEFEFEPNYDIPVKETSEYNVYQYNNLNGIIVDALGEDIVIKKLDGGYRIYRCGFDCWYYDIEIDSEHIPSLLNDETVNFVKLVSGRFAPVGTEDRRLCLFTNKGRILYNFVNGFADYFREAPVYNLKKRFYPVNDKSKVSAVAKYLPIYPDYDYDQFNGRVGNGTTDVDDFGLPLPTRGNAVGQLLEDFHTPDANFGKLVYSNFVNSKAYGCIYGNYNLVNGDPIVLASSDGAEWSVIESFASVEDYSPVGLTQLKVDLSTIITNAGGYTSGGLRMVHRKFNIPNYTNKEPVHPFTIGASALVASITVNEDNETIITFVDESALIEDPVELTRLTNFAPVFYFENVNASSEYDYICNACDQDGNNNTGIIFRLQRIGTNQYKLWGNVGDPYEGRLVCRHIHGVSEYQNGFIIGTGENYRINYGSVVGDFFEGGFVYKINTVRSTAIYNANYNHNNALTHFFNVGVPTYRITSSAYGVNRTCGAYLKSDKNNTLIFVSDYLYGTPEIAQIDGRENGFPRTKLGVYKISIKDVDDYSKADCVAEIKDTGLGLVEHLGRFFVCSSGGEAIFSPDFGNTWYYENISRLFHGGKLDEMFYTDVKGILNDGSVFYYNTRFVFK